MKTKLLADFNICISLLLNCPNKKIAIISKYSFLDGIKAFAGNKIFRTVF